MRRGKHIITSLTLPLAVAALAFALPRTARAGDGGTLKGTVSAEPAKDLRNTFVYLVKVPGHWPKKTWVMNQKDLHFQPHLLAIVKGDTVRFHNSDHVEHNVFSPDHESYNLGDFAFNQSRTYTFHHLGGYTQLCIIHPEMLAYIFVNQNPFAVGVDDQGHYEITGVPAGTWKLAVWNPELKGPTRSVTVKAGGTVTQDFTLKH